MVALTIPLIITVLGIIYIVSPIDVLPDFLPGAGWLDDLFVFVVIVFTWIVALGAAVIEALMPVIKVIAIIFAVMFGLKYLLDNKKKIKRLLK